MNNTVIILYMILQVLCGLNVIGAIVNSNLTAMLGWFIALMFAIVIMVNS